MWLWLESIKVGILKTQIGFFVIFMVNNRNKLIGVNAFMVSFYMYAFLIDQFLF